MKTPWRVAWKFAVHSLVASTIFSFTAAPAVLLNLVVQRLETLGINLVIISALKGTEYWIVMTDLACFAVFLWRSAKRTIQGL